MKEFVYGNEGYDYENEETRFREEDDSPLGDEEIKKRYASYYTKEAELKTLDYMDIMRRYHSNDTYLQETACEDMYKLMKNYITSIIRSNYPTYMAKYFEELHQQGALGVFKGMAVYNPEKTVPSTFFRFYIIHEIQVFVDSEIHHATAHYGQAIKKIRKVLRLYEIKGIPWTEKDIEIETNMPLDTIKACLKIINSVEISFEGTLEDENSLDTVLPSSEKTPAQEYVEAETTDTILKALRQNLSDEERIAVEMSFGLNGRTASSLKVIAEELDCSTELVSRYIACALEKLQDVPTLRAIRGKTNFKKAAQENEDFIQFTLQDEEENIKALFSDSEEIVFC